MQMHLKCLRTGTPGAIRTRDPLLRRQMLCPTELRAHRATIVAAAAGACKFGLGTASISGASQFLAARKGCHNPAQGNALGIRPNRDLSPERARPCPGPHPGYSAPSGRRSRHTVIPGRCPGLDYYGSVGAGREQRRVAHGSRLSDTKMRPGISMGGDIEN